MEADLFTHQLAPASGPQGLRAARHRLSRWLTGHGCRGPGVEELLTAVGEATANAYEHSGARDDRGPGAWVQAHVRDGRVRVLVADHGTWKPPVAGKHRGHGRAIMAAMVDRFVLHTGPSGTTVELVKKLPC